MYHCCKEYENYAELFLSYKPFTAGYTSKLSREENGKKDSKACLNQSGLDKSFIHTIIGQSYIQHVDGKTLGFDEFVKHLKALKEKTKSIRTDFKTLIGEGKIVSPNHVGNCNYER